MSSTKDAADTTVNAAAIRFRRASSRPLRSEDSESGDAPHVARSPGLLTAEQLVTLTDALHTVRAAVHSDATAGAGEA
jgi:hypothetical protein